MERLRPIKEACLQFEPAFCTAACPFHFDFREFATKLERGAFNAAFREYQNAVGFPGIVSALCDEPCRQVCPRKEAGGAISLRLLEKAALHFARNRNPNNYNLPAKPQKVAVIGAGISGLACALRMAARKYDVTVYERSPRIGGALWDMLPPEIFLKDIELQFQYERYCLHLGTPVGSLDGLDYDAVYVASGAGGDDFGLREDPGGAYATTTPGVFMGGGLRGAGTMQAIADGLQAAGALERYIKAGGMNQPRAPGGTRIIIDTARIPSIAAVQPADGVTYNKEEAVQEAQRCLKCACDACMRACDLMQHYKKFPRRIEEEVEITIHPGTLDGDGTVATRLISTCNVCGLCKEVCPQDIDTGEFLLQSHRTMRAKGAMPWAFHDFWLRDMAFSNGAEAYLLRRPPGGGSARWMFFPGCRLGGSHPDYVLRSYAWLLAAEPGTALMLGCCGAPADWAGDEPLHNQELERLRSAWEELERPRAVFACPTCKAMFEKYLPEIEGAFLYTLYNASGAPLSPIGANETVSVFDPCASRGDAVVQAAVRALSEAAGMRLAPLPYEGRLAQCCSWGGQVSIANPPYAQKVVQARIGQNEHPYVTYCSNCRDIFSAAGKPVYHILDVLFGILGKDSPPPTASESRDNRRALKRLALQQFWKEEVDMEKSGGKSIFITPDLRLKLDQDMILEEEIAAVIEFCESSGKKIRGEGDGRFIGHMQIGKVTYWVIYIPEQDGFRLINAYCHRMCIGEE